MADTPNTPGTVTSASTAAATSASTAAATPSRSAQTHAAILEQAERLFALATFNAGIELGQLGVIATVLLTVGWLRDRAWYRGRIVVPASAGIALTGLFWTVERVLA